MSPYSTVSVESAGSSTSYVPAPDGPGPFYLGLGFTPTGEIDDGEIVLAYPPLHEKED